MPQVEVQRDGWPEEYTGGGVEATTVFLGMITD
jgi:hypothetical protein